MVLESRYKACPSGTRGDPRLDLWRVYPAKPSSWTGREDDLSDEDEDGKKHAVGRDEQRVTPQPRATPRAIQREFRNIHIIKGRWELELRLGSLPNDVKNTYGGPFSTNEPRSMGVRITWSIVYFRELSTSRMVFA